MRRGARASALGALAAVGALCAGCLSYSSYQDARIVPEGTSQATFAVSVSSYKDSDRPDAERFNWYPVEVSPRFNIARRFDGAVKLSYLFSPGEEDEFNALIVLGGDVRFAIVPDHLLFTFPVALAVGEYAFSTFQVQPGVVVTVPILEDLDVNGAARVHLFTGEELSGEDELRSYGFNAGLGWRISSRWTLRPEVGWLLYPEPDVLYTQFGLGLTATVGPSP